MSLLIRCVIAACLCGAAEARAADGSVWLAEAMPAIQITLAVGLLAGMAWIFRSVKVTAAALQATMEQDRAGTAANTQRTLRAYVFLKGLACDVVRTPAAGGTSGTA